MLKAGQVVVLANHRIGEELKRLPVATAGRPPKEIGDTVSPISEPTLADVAGYQKKGMRLKKLASHGKEMVVATIGALAKAGQVVVLANHRIGEEIRKLPKNDGGRPAAKTGGPRTPVSPPAKTSTSGVPVSPPAKTGNSVLPVSPPAKPGTPGAPVSRPTLADVAGTKNRALRLPWLLRTRGIGGAG